MKKLSILALIVMTFLGLSTSVNNIKNIDDYINNDLGRFNRRQLELGFDPATKQLAVGEIDTAVSVESRLGITLKRSVDPGTDWVDDLGQTYDALGSSVKPEFLDLANFKLRIKDHLATSNFVAVDVRSFYPAQASDILDYIKSLSASQQAQVIFIN